MLLVCSSPAWVIFGGGSGHCFLFCPCVCSCLLCRNEGLGSPAWVSPSSLGMGRGKVNCTNRGGAAGTLNVPVSYFWHGREVPQPRSIFLLKTAAGPAPLLLHVVSRTVCVPRPLPGMRGGSGICAGLSWDFLHPLLLHEQPAVASPSLGIYAVDVTLGDRV